MNLSCKARRGLHADCFNSSSLVSPSYPPSGPVSRRHGAIVHGGGSWWWFMVASDYQKWSQVRIDRNLVVNGFNHFDIFDYRVEKHQGCSKSFNLGSLNQFQHPFGVSNWCFLIHLHMISRCDSAFVGHEAPFRQFGGWQLPGATTCLGSNPMAFFGILKVSTKVNAKSLGSSWAQSAPPLSDALSTVATPIKRSYHPWLSTTISIIINMVFIGIISKDYKH